MIVPLNFTITVWPKITTACLDLSTAAMRAQAASVLVLLTSAAAFSTSSIWRRYSASAKWALKVSVWITCWVLNFRRCHHEPDCSASRSSSKMPYSTSNPSSALRMATPSGLPSDVNIATGRLLAVRPAMTEAYAELLVGATSPQVSDSPNRSTPDFCISLTVSDDSSKWSWSRITWKRSPSTFAVMRRLVPRLAGLRGFLGLWLVGGLGGEIGR